MKIVSPLVKVAGAVATPLLRTSVVQVQVGLESGVVAPDRPRELNFPAVRSGHKMVIGVVTVGGGLVSTVAVALLALQLASWVKVAVAVPLD